MKKTYILSAVIVGLVLVPTFAVAQSGETDQYNLQSTLESIKQHAADLADQINVSRQDVEQEKYISPNSSPSTPVDDELNLIQDSGGSETEAINTGSEEGITTHGPEQETREANAGGVSGSVYWIGSEDSILGNALVIYDKPQPAVLVLDHRSNCTATMGSTVSECRDKNFYINEDEFVSMFRNALKESLNGKTKNSNYDRLSANEIDVSELSSPVNNFSFEGGSPETFRYRKAGSGTIGSLTKHKTDEQTLYSNSKIITTTDPKTQEENEKLFYQKIVAEAYQPKGEIWFTQMGIGGSYDNVVYYDFAGSRWKGLTDETPAKAGQEGLHDMKSGFPSSPGASKPETMIKFANEYEDSSTTKTITLSDSYKWADFTATLAYAGDDTWEYLVEGQLPNPCYGFQVQYVESTSQLAGWVTPPSGEGECTAVVEDVRETGTITADKDADFDFSVSSDRRPEPLPTTAAGDEPNTSNTSDILENVRQQLESMQLQLSQ